MLGDKDLLGINGPMNEGEPLVCFEMTPLIRFLEYVFVCVLRIIELVTFTVRESRLEQWPLVVLIICDIVCDCLIVLIFSFWKSTDLSLVIMFVS